MNYWFRVNFSWSTTLIVLWVIGFMIYRIPMDGFIASDFIGIPAIGGCIWLCSVLIRAHHYAEKIDGGWSFYEARLRQRDVDLHQEPGGSDDAPCDSEYRFETSTIRIVYGSIRSWRLIRAIWHKKVSLAELESHSKWEHERIPTI